MHYADSSHSIPVPATTSKVLSMDDGDLCARVDQCIRMWRIDGTEGVVVRAGKGVVTLCGVVTSTVMKHRLHECCRHISGVREVVDRTGVLLSRSRDATLPH